MVLKIAHMLLECKILYNQFGRKALLLRLFSVLFPIYLIYVQNDYPAAINSLIICIAASFFVMDYTVNVFGLDSGAFYLRYMGSSPVWQSLIRRVVLGTIVQCAVAVFLSGFLFFRTSSAEFAQHLLIMTITIVQGFVLSCVLSAAFPRAVPRTIEKKIFRANPGAGLTVSALAATAAPTLFYALTRLFPYPLIEYYSTLYLAVLVLLALPASLFWSASLIRQNRYRKWLAVVTEQ